MNAEMIMGLVIISIVAVIMVIIGISQFNKKENPVGFYNVIAPPKKEEISDVIQWNKKHGFIWIVYFRFENLVFHRCGSIRVNT